MKVVNSAEMSRIESLAYEKGAQEKEFMEMAGHGIATYVQSFMQRWALPKVVTLLCGKGNNAGDAYVAGRLLHHLGYAVTAQQLAPIDECSPLCRENYYRFIGEGGFVKEVSSATDCRFPSNGVIIDGIFGTGFHGAAKGIFALAIEAANGSGLPIIAVDVPSGLNGMTGEVEGAVIKATTTLFLGLPKTGFFIQEGWNYVGQLKGVDFGLDEKFIDQANEDLICLTPDLVKTLMPGIKRTRHKYEAGLVMGLAGSPGMPGAALLSCLGALRSGCGMVRLVYPEGMEGELSGAPFELIRVPYRYTDIDHVVGFVNAGKAAFIGPGLGRSQEVCGLLSQVIPRLEKPCVLDADALSIVAEEEISCPKRMVLTPHRGEMHRLLGLSTHEPLTMDFVSKCQRYVDDKGVTLVLKGAPTFIFDSNESPLVCVRGDAGMATAGSGDVLTGIIAALLAQGLHSRDAAALGVCLHGVAGEEAASAKGSYSMIASDIIDHLSSAFKASS